MNYLGYIILVAVAAVVIYILVRKKGKVIGVIKPKGGQQAIIDSLTVGIPKIEGRFPRVLSQNHLADDVLQGIGDAFKERTLTATTKGWLNGLNPADYTIYVFPSVRDTDLDGNYSPVFAVFLEPGDAYIGSEYDKGTNGSHWIYAAEQCLTDGNGGLTNVFVIANNSSREYTKRATSYGLDHLLLWHNNRPEYERTKTHESGQSPHPLW